MKVRTATKNDYENIAKLEQKVWGDGAASYDIIRTRHEIFPSGSIVVVDKNEAIVGYAAVQRVNRACCDSWHIQTGNGDTKSTHTDKGHILYGIGMAGASFGVAEIIIEYVYKTFIESGVCYMLVLGSRVPGFAKWQAKNKQGIKKYIQTRRKDGYSIDPELMLYQKNGFEVLCEIDNYFPCQDSLNYGALIIIC